MHTTFRFQKVLELQRGSLTKFFTTRSQKNFGKEIGDIPLLTQKLSIPEIFWGIEGKAVMLPLQRINIFGTRKFLSYKRVRLWSFPALKEKIFAENLIAPSFINSFRYENICETKKVRVWSFPVLWENYFAQKLIPASLISKIFQYQKFSESQKCSLTKFFSTVSQKTFDGKWWDPPTSCSETFRNKEVSEKQKRYLTQFFVLVLWDEKFSTNPWRPPSIHENFRHEKASELQKGSPMKFSGTMRQIFPQNLILLTSYS